jgi:glycogen debranching enzyme
MMRLNSKLIPLLLMLIIIFCSETSQARNMKAIDRLTITVSAPENREFAYTDKESAYFYGHTHSLGKEWFSGWNVNTERIFQDYKLSIDGVSLDRSRASVKVSPHLLRRVYQQVTESFRMFDNQRVLMVELEHAKGRTVSISLFGPLIKYAQLSKGIAYYRLTEKPEMFVAVASISNRNLTEGEVDNNELKIENNQAGFFIILGSSESTIEQQLKDARANHHNWSRSRAARMEALLKANQITSSMAELDAAISWNLLSLDALITKQSGNGIYAGLPWFNDYWGRDMFISLPGACLVTGQFETARKILQSFAQFQNKDQQSKFYGRVPNRVRPDEIIYNTVDGTPRFVIALQQYVKYSGDTAIIDDLYPVVQRSIEGAIKWWVDEKGYLTHDDADTWMDAKKDGKIPFSPRGNRANDIQSLWLAQLSAGCYFAEVIGNNNDLKRWQTIAARIRVNFQKDFFDKEHDYMADRLTVNGEPDFSFRPNQLFAMDFVEGAEKYKLLKKIWQQLVFPWGVASLSQTDANFHPWHENWEKYHKDEAYHNGTVWLWNNGIAMQRMLEAGEYEMPFQLFHNMSRQTLYSGAVGCLSELTDALPRSGASSPKLSGAFSQAWSSAEYLRVWYQYFLGIRPDAIANTIYLEPQLSKRINKLQFKTVVFNGAINGELINNGKEQQYLYDFAAMKEKLKINFKQSEFLPVELMVTPGDKLVITISNTKLKAEITTKRGAVRTHLEIARDNREIERDIIAKTILQNLSFAEPNTKIR